MKITDKLIQLTLEVRQLEESLQTCNPFKDATTPKGTIEIPLKERRFRSATLTTAFNQLRIARMLCGDMLRVCGVEHPYQNSYVGKLENEAPKYMENGGLKLINWDGEIPKKLEKGTSAESYALGFVRSKLGNAKDDSGLFYQLKNLGWELLRNPNHHHLFAKGEQDIYELDIYAKGAMTALKLANCHLGLRFGELV